MHISAALILAASSTLFSLTSAAPAGTNPQTVDPLQPKGITVSHLAEGEIDWDGLSFGYVEVTLGNDFVSPIHNNQTSGCKDAGLLCGAYHLAFPNVSSGDEQAKYFVNNGGDWTQTDEKRLPGGVVVGYAYKHTGCFGLTPEAMVQWLHDFSDEYHQSTGRYPIIGTSYAWWENCTKNDSTFKSTNALALLGPDQVPGQWG
ncbi:hypothetical protein FRC03_001727 [Tulasnella sp. 419]|nr:hypothetical protein FRC03_001727 [Tulasnella sp. 419]